MVHNFECVEAAYRVGSDLELRSEAFRVSKRPVTTGNNRLAGM